MTGNRLRYLFSCFFNKTATEQEKDELMNLLHNTDDEQIKFLMDETWKEFVEEQNLFSPDQRKEMLRNIIQSNPEKENDTVPITKRFSWTRLVAAAVIVLTIGFVAYFLNQNNQQTEIVKSKTVSNQFNNDIPPGGEKAILTLADGSTIILDSAKNGLLAQQGNTRVMKLQNGQVAFNPDDAKENGKALYNTVSTPRGGQYQIVLPDASKVWLNASSSLRFPISFVGKERRVELTGEAYFEVAENKRMPFKVLANNLQVEVLGTHFNVMCYDDESSMKTTLKEGKLKVTRQTRAVLLIPAQQATFNKAAETLIVNQADVEKELAWKNGMFNFNDENIEAIMRQLSRWYDVDVSFEGEIPQDYYLGIIRRQSDISQVLNMLELAGGVKFKIAKNKVLVHAK
jgi:transmembrane sensor